MKSAFLRNFCPPSLTSLFVGVTLLFASGAHASDMAFNAEPGPEQVSTLLKSGGNPVVVPGDSGLTFCHTEKWSNSCLFGLIAYRCGQYAFPLPIYGCTAAAAALVTLLDMKRISVTDDNGQTFVLPVIFTTRLEAMIQDPLVQDDLRGLKLLLNYYGNIKRKFNLYEWVRMMHSGDMEKTLEWLAVLLQDTSGVQIQIAYLDDIAKKRKFSEATKLAIDHLSEISLFLSNENLTKINYKTWLSLYPQTKHLDAELTPLIYHFYPMSYLANQLMSVGLGSRLSSFIPFLFNTEYEHQSLDPEMWPLQHPRPEKIDLKQEWIRWKMRDMYGGMAGALFGVDELENAPGLAPFQTDYAKNPFRAMQSYFWWFPSP